ncbi:MAG TPA: DsrE family protein [Tenuifilaceae bacterium]|mgnify:FL=1|nr:DsrE family protein [Tenuifilaceae bacterium]
MREKLIVIVTEGPDNQEKATIPFVMATAAQSMDVDVTIILQAEGVLLVKKGVSENVNASGFMPLKQLLDTFIELNGKLLVCTPCAKSRGISENDLIEGSKLIAAGTVISESLNANAVLSY